MTEHDALVLIGYGRPQALLQWAEQHGVDDHIVAALRKGYTPHWQGAAAYRGAVVHVLKAIARACVYE